MLATMLALTAVASVARCQQVDINKHLFINGNHAVYVEPPADFQPIIYETRAPQHDHHNNHHHNNHHNNHNHQQQQLAPAQVDAEQELTSNQLQESRDFLDSGAFVVEGAPAGNVKPAVGRWSDWRDMSVEPELAASESNSVPVKGRAPSWRLHSRCASAQAREPAPAVQARQPPAPQPPAAGPPSADQAFANSKHPLKAKKAPHFIIKKLKQGKRRALDKGTKSAAAHAYDTKRADPIPRLAASKSKKRARRRRIKSTLPVGLSSWFLGGIRDLDGRHWQLSPEVISKLAVNDSSLLQVAKPASKVAADETEVAVNQSALQVPAGNQSLQQSHAVQVLRKPQSTVSPR